MTRYWSKNVAQTFPKFAQIDATAFFTLRDPIQNSPRSQMFSQELSKSPNMVTLPLSVFDYQADRKIVLGLHR